MPRERCLINLSLRVVALLFRVEAHSGSMASQACCPAAGRVDTTRSSNNAAIFA
jgi:hypothetical protein